MTATPPKPKPIRTTHDLMVCPVCGTPIVAMIEVQQTLGNPLIHDLASGAVSLPVEARMVRFDVSHDCRGPVSEATPEEVAS